MWREMARLRRGKVAAGREVNEGAESGGRVEMVVVSGGDRHRIQNKGTVPRCVIRIPY